MRFIGVASKMFKDEYISSRSNPTVKWAASLSEKKGREAAKSFIAEGEKLTLEALGASLPVSHVFICESYRERIIGKLNEALDPKKHKDVRIITLADSAFEKISTEKSPQGVISVIKHLDFFSIIDIIYKKEFFLDENERAIALCSVRDPGNLGSVVRSAVAFGVDRIILSSDCADVYNPKTVRSAMGSLFKVKISVVSNMHDFIEAAKENGRRVFAAELTDNAIPLSEASLTSRDIIIIGNEGHGIPKDISALSDASVYIPISQKTESLNASVAAAIFIWEQSKQA